MQSDRSAAGVGPVSPVAVGTWGSASTCASTIALDGSLTASATIDLGEGGVQPLSVGAGSLPAETDGDRVVLDLRDTSTPRESPGGERYLLVRVPPSFL